MSNYTEIERDAALERQKLAQSLDSLTAAVRPENMKVHAAALAETYGGDLGRQAWGAAKSNPAAFALVGAGLSLLFTGAGTRPEAQPKRPVAVPAGKAMIGFDARLAAADQELKQEMTGMSEYSRAPRAAWLRAKLHDGLDALPEGARRRVLKAREATLLAQDQVEAKAREASKKSKTFMHDQPLAVGALALGLGALIGALLPSTRREDDLLGERRDAVMFAAKSSLQEEMDKVHQSARASLKNEPRAAG